MERAAEVTTDSQSSLWNFNIRRLGGLPGHQFFQKMLAGDTDVQVELRSIVIELVPPVRRTASLTGYIN